MKKLILSAVALTVLCLGQMNAQTANAPAANQDQKAPMTPEQEAAKHATKLTTQLGLNDEQKAKVQALDLDRINANRALRDKERAAANNEEERKTLRQQVKANNDKFQSSVMDILTPEQKTKWEEQKKEMKEKKEEKNSANQPK